MRNSFLGSEFGRTKKKGIIDFNFYIVVLYWKHILTIKTLLMI